MANLKPRGSEPVLPSLLRDSGCGLGHREVKGSELVCRPSVPLPHLPPGFLLELGLQVVTFALPASASAPSSGWPGPMGGGHCYLLRGLARFGWAETKKRTVLPPLIKPVQGASSDIEVNTWARVFAPMSTSRASYL